MYRSIGILRKLKYTIPQSSLMLLYNSLIYPYLLYCSIIWGANSIYKLNPILILQKKAVRIIANADFRAHSSPLFTKYKLLKVVEISQFQVAVFMFKFSIGQLPTKFNSYFIRTTSIHQYSTRSSLYGYVIPFVRTSVAKRKLNTSVL